MINIFHCGKGDYDSNKVSNTIKREQYCIKCYKLYERSTANLPDFIVHTGADTVYSKPSITLLQVLIGVITSIIR